MTNRRLSLLVALLVLMALPALAAGPRRIVVMADFSDQAQFQVENQLIQALQEMQSSGRLAGVPDLDPRPMVINTGQEDGGALLKRWDLTPADLPLLGIVEGVAGESPARLGWRWEVGDVPSALRALSVQLGVPEPRTPVIRAADFSPRRGPLHAGQEITITVQGVPGGNATGAIGGVQGIALFEQQPGLYRGSYTVGAQDRTDAQVRVTLTGPNGDSESRDLGSVVLQGLETPTLQSVRQVGGSQWVLTGTAPPNSQVSIQAVISQSFIFKFTSKYDFQGTADADGRFQIYSQITDNVGGSEGTFTVKAIQGGSVSQAPPVKLVFQGNGPPPPPVPSPIISPYSLAGTWWHGMRQTSIRVAGNDSVVIRNEFGNETQLWVTGPWTVATRGFFGLSGNVTDGGQAIEWNNGTRWTRSPVY